MTTPGATNVSLYVYFVDDDGGTAPGEPTTGKLFSNIETGGSASYMRQGAARTDFTLITLASASATHADGGFILVDDTNMPGLYRVDVPDAAFSAGVDFVIIQLVMASANNSIMRPLLVDLTAAQTGDNFARLGAPVAASISADIAVVDLNVDQIETAVITNAAGTDIAADIIEVKTETAAILVDTGTTLDGKLDTIDTVVDAVKVITDQFVFTVANQVDSNVLQIEGADATDQINAAADVANTDYGALQPTTAGRTLDVTAAGEAGIDFDNTVGTISAAQIATDAIGAAELASDGANKIADALLDRAAGVETNRTLRQALRLILSSAAGKLSGAATTTVTIKDTNDDKSRIIATVDANGNRSAVTLDTS